MKSSAVRLAVAGVCALMCVAVPERAESASVTFQFDYEIDNQYPFALIPGSFGTLTLTDSLVDPNRVDFTLNLTPRFGATLERFYLNWYKEKEAQHQFYLVSQNAPIGSQTQLQGASVTYTNTNLQFGQFMFDISPVGGGWPLNFSGSLAYFNINGTPDTPVNLDVAHFIALSGGDREPELYAAYRTHNFENLGEFWAGASTIEQTVPEPASMMLIGTGLLGLAGYGRRRTRR